MGKSSRSSQSLDLSRSKILITGGHGFVGKHLVRLLQEKYAVPRKNLFAPTSKERDFLSFDDCYQSVKGKDVVIHLAARVGGIGANKESPGSFFYENLIMGAQLMEAARLVGINKFVSVGTVCSYPKFARVPFREEALWDGYPEETNAPYGLAKKMLLVQGQAYRQQYGLNVIHLLPANMYGEGDNFNLQTSHVIPAIIRKCIEGRENGATTIRVWGSGKATREFLYVEDAVEGIVLATQFYNEADPINIGSSQEISIQELVELITQLTGFKGEIVWDASLPDGQPRRKLEVSKAKKLFGFSAQTSLETGLRRTIDWYEASLKSKGTYE